MYAKNPLQLTALFVLLWLVPLGNSLLAQQYYFRQLGLEDGLPTLRINGAVEDSRGFIWMATSAGLIRYDGFSFVEINKGDPSQSYIGTVGEDEAGNLWYTTQTDLFKYDGRTLETYPIPQDVAEISKLTFGAGEVVLLDKKGRLLKFEQGQIAPVNVPDSLRISDVLFVEGQLMARYKKGILKLSEGGVQVVLSDFSRDDDLWMSALGVFSVLDGTVKKLDMESGQWNSIRDDHPLQAFVGRESLAIISSGKLLRIGEGNGLPKGIYNGGFIDRSQVLWLYSNNGITLLENIGLARFDLNDQAFSTFMSADDISYVGTASGLWQFTDDQPPKVFNQEGGSLGVILAITEFRGQIYFGTENGLYRLQNSVITKVEVPFLDDQFIFSLFADGGKLWLGTGSGIFSFDGRKVVNETVKNALPISSVFSISKNEDKLWFATYTQGVIIKLDDEWEVISRFNGVRLDSLRFTAIVPVSENEMWIATLNDGLYHISSESVHHIEFAEMEFAEVSGMALDSDSILWVSSNKGVFGIYHNRNGYFINKSQLKTEPGDQGSANAISAGRSKVTVGTHRGVQIFDRRLNDLARMKPTGLEITDVKLFLGEVDNLAEYASDSLAFTKVPSGIELPYDQNFISINYSGLTGYQPERLQYRYRLSSSSGDWTYAGRRREAIFSNLKPGQYNFELQVGRKGLEWSGSSTYSFSIRSPFWQTWWFITASVLFVIGITVLFIWYRIKRANQKLRFENALMEMERKALRLQMNPHFIFNALDSISSFIFKNDPQAAVLHLNNFAKLMRLTLESSMEHLHPVETEVMILKNYLELEKLRFQGKFDYGIEVDDEIDYDIGIPPMLIQPHVENAILHGVKPMEAKGRIDIRFIVNEDTLICEVEDNGIGRKRSKELNKRRDHRSMATQINKDRIRLLKTSLSDQVDIQIIDKVSSSGDAEGTKVIIKLPAESI